MRAEERWSDHDGGADSWDDEPSPAAARPKGWIRRNPGCAIALICAAILLCIGLFVGGLFAIIMAALRSNDAYRTTVAAAQADPALRQALGTPIEPHWLVLGSIHVSGSSGSANLTITVSGPKGSANIQTVATMRNNRWTFERMEAFTDAEVTVDLRPTLQALPAPVR